MKYKSCHLIEHGIFFGLNKVSICCMLPNILSYQVPLIDNYHGEKINWEDIKQKKRIYRNMFKEGKILPTCEGCYNLEEQDWPDNDTIDCLFISHWSHCNCNCSYCYFDRRKKFYNSYQNYKLLPILQDMQKNKMIGSNSYVCFGGGEPTILDEFKDILELLYTENFKTIIINSSGILYDKVLAKGIESGKVELTVSLDCGDAKLFKKIKRINKYNDVVKNLKKYVAKQGENNLVRVKYIIIPTLNDTIDDVEKWIKTIFDIGVKTIILDVETVWFKKHRNNIPRHIYELIQYTQKRAEELNLDLQYYSHASQIVHEHKELKPV